MNKEMAESFGLSKADGALVSKVEKGSPAEKAGIQEGDVILKFDGKAVGQSADLSRIVGSTHPGSQSTLDVWRHGKMMTLNIVIDYLIGLVPFVGNILDALWKANRMNLRLLVERSTVGADEERKGSLGDWLFIGVIMGVVLGFVAATAALSVWLLYYVFRNTPLL